MGAKANAITSSMIKSMGMVAQAKATGLNYDRTHQMVVVAIEDADKNSYKVSDGNTTFVAFGADDVKYRVNDSVYVKIPTGNTTGRKIIIGKYTVENEAATHSNSPLFNMIRMKEIKVTSDLLKIDVKHKEANEKTVDIILGDWIKKQGPFGFYDYIGIDIYFDNKGIKNNTEGQYSAEINYGKKTPEEIIPELFHSYVDFNINSRGLYGNPNATTKFFKHTFYCDKDDYTNFVYEPLNPQGGDDYTEVLRITLATNDMWDKAIYEEGSTIAISKIVLWFSYDKSRFDKDQVYLYLERTSHEGSTLKSTGRCYMIQNQELVSEVTMGNLSIQCGHLDEANYGQIFNRWDWDDSSQFYSIDSLEEDQNIFWQSVDPERKELINADVVRLVYQYNDLIFYSPYLLREDFWAIGTDYVIGENERSVAYYNYLYWILDIQLSEQVGYQVNGQYYIPYYYWVGQVTETYGQDPQHPKHFLYDVSKILESNLLEQKGFNLIINNNEYLNERNRPRVSLKTIIKDIPSQHDESIKNRYLDLSNYNNERVYSYSNSPFLTYYYTLINSDSYFFPYWLPETKKTLHNTDDRKKPYQTENDFYSFGVELYCLEKVLKEDPITHEQEWVWEHAYKEIFSFTLQFQDYYNIETGYASEPQIYLDKYGSLGPASNSITITPKVMQRGFPQMTLGDFFSTYTIGCTWTPSSKIVVDKGNNSTITITSPFEYEIDRKNNSIIVSKSENLKLFDSNVYEMDKIIENHCVLMITVDGTIKYTDKIFHYEFYYPIGISNMGYNISEPTVKYNDIIKMSKNWTLIDANGAMVPDITWKIRFGTGDDSLKIFDYTVNGTALGNAIISDVNMTDIISQPWNAAGTETITDRNNYNGKHMLEGYDKDNKLVWLSPFYAEPW